MKKFFLTTYTIKVLSEYEPASGLELDLLHALGSDGPCVGDSTDDGGVELTPDQMRQALLDARSSPSFFNLDDDEDDDPMGATYCEQCANPLESGQIGLCDGCQED